MHALIAPLVALSMIARGVEAAGPSAAADLFVASNVMALEDAVRRTDEREGIVSQARMVVRRLRALSVQNELFSEGMESLIDTLEEITGDEEDEMERIEARLVQ